MRTAPAVLSLLTLLSCRNGPAPASNDDGAANDAATAASIDEAAVKAMSHALLEANGRADAEAFAGALGPTFTLFDELHLVDRDELLRRLRARRDRHAPFRSLTYSEEHVALGANTAVFIGEAVEHIPPDGTHASGDFDGWNTLVWVRENGAWKAASWQWVKGGLDAERAEWDSTYREGRAFNPEASKFLTDVVKGRKPGTALDIAMGQGRNSLYLASQGWQVTGIDISTEALRQARDAADKRKLHIEVVNADARTWDHGIEKWDLVVMTYAGCCGAQTVETLRTSMKHGGILVAEGVAGDKDELPGLFKDGFTVVRDEIVEGVSDWDWGSAAGRDAAPRKLFRFVAEKR